MAAPIKPQANELGLSLALAMVVSSTAPLLLLDGDLRIVAASASFCQAFHLECASVPGRVIFELGSGEWDVRQLRSLMAATASGDADVEAYEMDLHLPKRAPRRLVLNVQKLAYGEAVETRLLVAIADVTEARAGERRDRKLRQDNEHKNQELVRDNELLMQEVRHRIANSLQIIASVMMQTARRASSEETRGHLRDAHHRVMSVAELQQQLAVSTQGTVNFREYLTKLCETINASMIDNTGALTLSVAMDDVIIDAGASVSLGLIVTELVINALKHAFPNGAHGTITVGYRTDGPAWTLSVSDNGVGMATVQSPTPGLGTSIVHALARQLRARVDVEALSPGTKVSIAHMVVSALTPEPELAEPEPAV